MSFSQHSTGLRGTGLSTCHDNVCYNITVIFPLSWCACHPHSPGHFPQTVAALKQMACGDLNVQKISKCIATVIVKFIEMISVCSSYSHFLFVPTVPSFTFTPAGMYSMLSCYCLWCLMYLESMFIELLYFIHLRYPTMELHSVSCNSVFHFNFIYQGKDK